MNPALIEGATNNPGAPKGMEGQVRRLPIRVSEQDDLGTVCESAWKPTAEELAVLNDGGYVILGIVGWQPPVYLTITDRKGAQEL